MKRVGTFVVQNGILYQMDQDNKLNYCVTTNEVQKMFRKLHEGFASGHFITSIIGKIILDVSF
jgi:hypothetical protein